MLKILSILIVLVLIGGFAIYKGGNLMKSSVKKPVPQQSIPIVANEEKNITVSMPKPNSTVSSSVRVKGSARVFESVVSLELTDDNGTVLFEGTAMASAPDMGQFGPFEKEVEFDTDASNGILTVYQASAKDGSRIDVVTIPLKFK